DRAAHPDCHRPRRRDGLIHPGRPERARRVHRLRHLPRRDQHHPWGDQRPVRDLVGGVQQRRRQDPHLHLHPERCGLRDRERPVGTGGPSTRAVHDGRPGLRGESQHQAVRNQEETSTQRDNKNATRTCEAGPPGGGAGGAKRGRRMQRFTATVASLVMLLGVANYATAAMGIPGGLPPAPVACTIPLAGFGPIDPANGFPTYYQDSTGLALAQCLDTVCAGPAFVTTLPNPALPVSFPNNFPVEMFYSRAIAKTTVGAVSVLYTAALEGTFFNGVVALPGDQVVFTRVRIRVAGLQPGGLYTVTHPYGVKTFTAGGLGVINDTVTAGAVPIVL